MDWQRFENDIKNCRFDFTEEQLKNLKIYCTELYRLLKFVFDSPRKLQRPYTSLERYKVEKERVYQSPSDYYHFRDNETEIKLWKRRNSYSIAIFGDFIPDGLNFETLTSSEKAFSNGFRFYGVWSRSSFLSAVYTFNYVVKQYITKSQNSEALF